MKSLIRLFTIGSAVFLVSVALFSFSATTALAQEKAVGAVAEEDVSQKGTPKKEYALETMTVTAQKQEEDVRDVPISTSVFSEIDLEDKMIETVADIAKFTPGLEIVNYGCALKWAPAMRGLYSDYSSRSSSAGLYVDGVPVLDGTGFDETLTDIERIEVLRGPQGTLYGKNSEVGVINIITKKPDNEFRGKVSIEAGEDEKQQLSFNTSGPIVKDKFYIGLSGKHYEQDGFIKNPETGETIDDRKNNYGKINFRWILADALEASLIVSKVKYDDEANRMNVIDGAKDREIVTDLDAYNRSEVTLTALNISYNINDKFHLNSVTTSRVYNEKNANDFDYTNQTLFHVFADSEYKRQSQEVRLNYTGSGFKMLIGAYLDQGDTDIDRTNITFKGTRVIHQEENGNSLGLFTHLTYSLTKRLSLIGGLRYDREEKDYKDAGMGIDTDETWNEVSPKIALQYQFKQNVMAFATIAKGYRAGGFNVWSPQGYPLSYDEETLWSYEIGAKSSFWNNKVLLEASFYYMDIDDMQVDTYINAQDLYKSNAAQATSMGVDTQIKAKLTKDLQLVAGFSHNRCTFDEYKDALGDYEGNHSLFSPEYDFNIGAQYRHINGFFASADIVGYGKTYFDRENKFSRDPYELINAKLGYEMEYFDVYLYGKNIFDKKYDSDGIFKGYTVYSPPREIGLKMTYRF
ncbi:MAG: TonB-dependent receptor [Thermoplasmatales archaeon]|nr:TonB-dependent receptor [Thermoplasmatales archaeon]